MDFRKQRTQNIDGFYTSGRSNRPAIFRDKTRRSLKGATSEGKVNQTVKPKVLQYSAILQQNKPSLIGMNIPQSNFRAPSSSRGKKSNKRPWSRKRKVVTSILVVVVLLLGLTGWFGSRILGSLDKVFHGNLFSDAEALFSQADLKESDGRINILVAGDSSDQPGHGGADLTDSIMLISIDPSNHTGFMLSIPRDLWVYIPGMNSWQKINAANDVTNFNEPGLPKGGMGQLQQIVQDDLGIPVDYYGLVNYGGFEDAVNAVGGITIDINSGDSSNLYDAYTHTDLPNGEDKIDGQEALDLARARCDSVEGDICNGFPDSDFTRTMYQREMVVAILKKATTLGVLSDPLKITSLFDSLSNNVQTNLTLQDALTLDQVVKGMNFSKLGSYAYSNSVSGDTNPLLVSYTSSSGQDALIPSEGIGNYSGLKAYFQQLTSNNAASKENASIELLNGTNVNGLARDQQEALNSNGISNVSIGDAVGNYSQTLIVDNAGSKDPATKSLLESMFPGSKVVSSDSGSTEAGEASKYSSDDFVVIIGQRNANTGSETGSYTGSYDSYTGSNSSTTN